MATRHEPVEPNGVTAIRRVLSPRDHPVFFGAWTAASSGFAERVVAKRLPEGDFHDWTAIEAWAAGIARALPAHRTAPR
jgi:menaquinone-dependent protoporphyrinogen oxidase